MSSTTPSSRMKAAGEPLFACDDARGRPLGASGRRAGTVFGSFLHLIDREAGMLTRGVAG